MCELTVDLPADQILENKAILQHIQQMKSNDVLSWPSIGSQPLDEFNKEGLATMCLKFSLMRKEVLTLP